MSDQGCSIGDTALALNAFKMRGKLNDIKVNYRIYKVNGLRVVDEERYRVLNNLARKISIGHHCIAVRYTPTKDLNGIVVLGASNLGDRFTVNSYEFELISQGESLNIPYFRARSFFYEVLRARLEYHGFWSSAYNKYYRLNEDSVVDRKFRIFHGIFFRFEVLGDGLVLLVLDPLTRIVSYDTVYELASQWGYAKAKNILKDRYITVLVARKGGLSRSSLKVHSFRPDLRAGVDKIIEVEGRKYTIKEYYSDYLRLPKVADLIPDDAPIIEARPRNSNKILYIASSMAYLNYKTNEISPDYVKEIEEWVFIKPEQRLTLTRSFLSSINPLSHPYNKNIGLFEFEEEPIMLSEGKAGVFNPPKLKFGRDARVVDLSNYTKFFKKSIQELGVAKEISIPINSKLAVVYPENYITDHEARSFYKDIAIASRKIFNISLPQDPFLWGYRDNPSSVVNNYNRFKDRVLAAIVILRSDEDELYGFYKKLFKDKVSQMATVRLVRLKEQLPRKKLHVYKNAVINLASGLLGKLGLRPWLLERRLKANAYVGIDLLPGRAAVLTLMDGCGNYIGESWVTLRGSKISSNDIHDSLYQLIIEKLGDLYVGKEFSIVFMKDGDIYEEEVEGIKGFINSITSEYSMIKYAVLSIKKSVPYRVYAYRNNKASYPNVGSYTILGESCGILASSGYPIIKNRLAKPMLIELIEASPEKWYSIYDALQESYELSFTHWATLTQKTKYPAPIKYADDFSSLVSKGITIAGPPL